ncbi:MAG: hydroxyacid dehydrogenase [Spirochaetales bacterium]|nr:hydroxyacid dehydrogenase [Spirochaetales bacterium]
MLPLSVLEEFPALDSAVVDRIYQQAWKNLKRKIVVIDDDPTGVQTVHDVDVYTTYGGSEVLSAFKDENPVFYILTNSRGFSRQETELVHRKLARKIAEASRESGKKYLIVSRSDSTLRGHFPLETEVLNDSLGPFDGEILIPFFPEGGRYTFDDIHYVKEPGGLVPAGRTEFAKDKTFGYVSSDLKDYVEEKTKGRFRRDDVVSISLEEIRAMDFRSIERKLMAVECFNKVIVNLVSYDDLKIFTVALINALTKGKSFLFRSAAALVKVLGNISDKPLLEKDELVRANNQNGGLIIVGSHVSKTTRQLEALKNSDLPFTFIEYDQYTVLEDDGMKESRRVTDLANRLIAEGKNVVIYTKRERMDVLEGSELEQLVLAARISSALTRCVEELEVEPRFIVAKGGITSNDVGIHGLKARKSNVLGQILKGVPVWQLGPESRFPGLSYVIFPGNVGDEDSLVKACRKLIV